MSEPNVAYDTKVRLDSGASAAAVLCRVVGHSMPLHVVAADLTAYTANFISPMCALLSTLAKRCTWQCDSRFKTGCVGIASASDLRDDYALVS